jgi:gliding motility-associated-like protein
MKHLHIKIFLLILFSLAVNSQSFSQTATTNVTWSGFQACGGCTVCGSDYWCTNTPGSYCGDTPPCSSRTFFDPVPAGNTVTGVTINYYTASCYGASFISTISGFAVPIAYDGASGCLCDDLPCMMTTSVTASYPCGMPGYVYGGNNTFELCSDGSMCINRAELVFTYYPTDVVIPTITASGPLSFCAGGNVTLTADNGYSAYHWNTGANSQSINVTTPGVYTVSVTGVTGCTTNSASVTVTIAPSVTPNFAAIAAFCSGASPPALSNTSPNGISGTWSPATINNTTSGVYTFTPNAGQCALPQTLNVTVTPAIGAPNFAAIPAFCTGSTPPTLSNTSPNGITGTWSPSTINNTASGSYTFTPTAGQCATPQTINVTVNPQTVPNFAAIPAFCSGSVAPVLNNTSPNGISGTWNPATINNSTSGTYIFTPNAGQCATTQTLNTTVSTTITPNFAVIPPFCSGSVAPVLNNTSLNGITGSWSPATISNTTSGTYTFTPNAGQCAVPITLSITVISLTTPNFAAIPAFCSGSTPPTLSNTSPNGISGTWSPATINNTTSGAYIFTPNAGQCATTQTLNITVTPQTIPNFAAIPAFCSGSTAPVLGNTSPNGVIGTWSPSIVSNTASGTYTFSPNVGQCATTQILNVDVTQPTVPNFAAIPAFCSGSVSPVLPNTSPNGVAGTWNPATISNTTSGTYTFTPSVGLCATTQTLSVTINSQTVPNFAAIPAFCSGTVAPVLSNTSPNGINGTWSPSTVSNTASGTYTFTPNAGECATTQTLNITVTSQTAPNFAAIPAFCSGSVPPGLSTISPNGISGSWSPSTINNTTSGTYTFTPNAGQCATNQTLNVTVYPKPTVNAGADTAIGSCSYSNYIMNPTPTGTIVTWNWTGNGVSPTNTQNPTAHPTTGTNYIVTVTDNNGCTASDNIFINVRPLPTAAAGADVSIGSCPSSDTTLFGVGTGAGPLSYTWSPSAGITPIPPSGQNVIAKPNITTTYIFTVTDRFGCTAIDNIIVNVNPLPTSEAGNNVNIGTCATSTAALSGTATGTGPLTYSWSPTTGLTTPNSQNTTAKPTVTTTYQLTVKDVYGCTAIDNVTVTVIPITVEAGANADIGECSNSTTILSGSATGTGPFTNISWGPPNGLSNTSIASPVTAHPTTTTTYTLNMTDAYGCSAFDNVTVTVHPFPTVDAGYNDSIGSCASSIATLNGSASGSTPFVYLWTPSGGLSNTNTLTPTAKPALTTVYVLTVTDIYSCSASDNVTITVKPLPTTNAGADTTIGYCNTSVAFLSGTGTGTAALNYLWSPTTGIGSVNSPFTSAKPSSTTTYTLTITDRFGCTASDNITVNISTVTAQAGNDVSIGTCAGSIGQINGSASGTGPFIYNWSPPNGLNQTNIANPTAQPAVTTLYSLVVTDLFNCTATDAVIVSVNTFDESVLHFTMIPDQGCQPLTTTFGFTPNTDIVPDSWLWDFGDISNPNHTSTELNPVYTFVNTGNYIVTLSVTSIYGCTVSYSDTVKVSRKPIADFNNVPSTASTENPRIEFFDQSSYANHWHWNFGDPQSHSDNTATSKDAVHIYSDSGSYTVILIVSNNEGCSDTAEKIISIYQSFAFFIPNAFTPNEDDVNEVFLPQGVGCRTTGYMMLIFDRWGKQLFKNEDLFKGWDGIRSNGDPYSQGVYTYLIKVVEESGKKHTYKGIVTIVSPDHNH